MIKLLKLLPLPLVAAAVLPIWGHSGSWPTQADDSGPRMSLNVAGAETSCDAASEPTECVVPLGAEFTLAVEVIGAPDEGYVGIQSEVFYDGLAYQPRDLGEEIVWPETALPVRFPAAPTGLEGLVQHGDASNITPPFPPSDHTGNIVEIALKCPAQPQSSTLALLPYDAATRALGAGFQAAAPGGGIGDTVPAKAVGQQTIDVDGDTTPEVVDIADTLDINCVGPTPTATHTATPPGLPGDVSCDGSVNSIDAALVLQYTAGLIDSLVCAQNADVNGDGATDSIDAALILQLDAGLIGRLPLARASAGASLPMRHQ